MLSVSVVVPVRNAARTLPACLAALAALDPAPTEIVLVDNGSTDGSGEALRTFAREHARGQARVADEPRRGASAARNAGGRAAVGAVLAFTDADCAPDPAWLRHLTAPFADPAVGAVAGRVLPAPARSTVELFSALYTLRSPLEPARHRAWTPWEGGFPTANFAVRRALLFDLGGFDERLRLYGEDYDVCARLYARGMAIEYTPEARVLHHHRTALTGLLRQAFGFGRSHAYLLRRHAGPGLWAELPRRGVRWAGWPGRVWIDVAAPDKKLLAILALGALSRPMLFLLAPYLLWLAVGTARRARDAGMVASPLTALALAGLLLLKSAGMTAGRWWGSLRYGAVCF